jgi:hypothetical protein
MKNFSYTPDCDIIFFPFDNENTVAVTPEEMKAGKGFVPEGRLKSLPKDTMKVNPVSAQDDIMSCSTSKSKGGGGFSCTLAPNRRWKDILSPGSWCIIYMKDSPIESVMSKVTDPASFVKKIREINPSDEKSGIKMIGVIRSIRESIETSSETGITRTRYNVTGEDFSLVFKTPIYLNFNLKEALDGQDTILANAILILGNKFGHILKPHEMIDSLMRSLLGSPDLVSDKSLKIKRAAFQSRGGEPFRVPKELSSMIFGSESNDIFTGMLAMFLQEDLIGSTQISADLGAVVTPWSLMDLYSNKMVNELYTELLPVNVNGSTRMLPSVIFRSIPFSSPKGKEQINVHKDSSPLVSMQDSFNHTLATLSTNNKAVENSGTRKERDDEKFPDVPVGTMTHFYISKEIENSEIVSLSSGKSDAERFNFFYVTPNMGNEASLAGKSEVAFVNSIMAADYSNIVNIPSVARYGLRLYLAHSDYMMIGDSSAIGVMNNICRDIWEPAYLYESGQVVIKGSGIPIPIGTNILFLSDYTVAHVERVDNSFSVDPNTGVKNFRTTISFIRRQRHEARFLKANKKALKNIGPSITSQTMDID